MDKRSKVCEPCKEMQAAYYVTVKLALFVDVTASNSAVFV